MICLNCGGWIRDGKTICPYCNTSVSVAKEARDEDDRTLEKRYKQIDEAFGFNVDVSKMPTDKLENFIDDISQRFDEYHQQNKMTKDSLEKVLAHLEKVDTELQDRYPVRKTVEIISTGQQSTGIPILDLLSNYTPPEVHASAAKIRSTTERLLRDEFKYPYLEYIAPDGKKVNKFKHSYFYMFNQIIKDRNIAQKIYDDHKYLNKFVHESKKNDQEIESKLGTKESQADYLKKVYELRKKYCLC